MGWTIINFISMEDKTETKMGVHQILTKNGFYRLPMHSLTEILKLLEMPESLEPKSIQENAINGILKLIQKHNSKFSEYIQASKVQGVSKETKDYVNVILQDSFNFLTKKSLYQLPPPPPLYPSQMPASMPGYPPMSQYSYMRPPVPVPGSTETDPEAMKILDEQMRMQQQMYMYYYGMYGMNPMFNPGYMNPYGAYGQMPNGKSATGGSAPMPPMGMHMPMGPMGPMPPLGMPPLGPMAPGFPPKPLSRAEENALRIKETPLKETQPKLTEKKSKLTDEGKAEKEREKEKEKAVLKSEEKKKAEKVKLSLQNPPFVVSETPGNTRKVKEQKGAKTGIINELLRNCACKGVQKYEQVFLCSICNRTFHYRCLNQSVKKSQGQGLECYHCRLRFIDPLNRVKEVIAEHYIPNISDNKFWMTCNLKPYEYLCRPKGGKNEIEMRCLKVSSNDANQITWPDQCIIKLNGERIIEIPALQINSSLKKRKDYSIIITQNIYNKANESDSQALEKVRLSLQIRTLTKEEISHRKIKNNFTFAFAIYFVERLTVDELYQKVVAEERVPESPDYLQRLMRTTSNDIEIDKIVINLYDPFTWDVIHTPVRGSRCLHGQCFDLKTFISFMSTARNRTWKCPVCGKDARKFMVDSQQSQLIKRVQETKSVPSQITFMKDGTIVLKVDNHEEQDQHVSSSRPEKTKKIHKEKEERHSRERESESRKEEADLEPRVMPEKEEQPIQQERRPVPAATEIVQLDEEPQEEPAKQQ